MPDSNSRSDEPEPLLITVKDVAKILGLSTRSVWRLLRDKKLLRPVRIGGAVRWRSRELRQWVDAGCPEPPKDE